MKHIQEITFESIHKNECPKLYEEKIPLGLYSKDIYTQSFAKKSTTIFVSYKVYIGFKEL